MLSALWSCAPLPTTAQPEVHLLRVRAPTEPLWYRATWTYDTTFQGQDGNNEQHDAGELLFEARPCRCEPGTRGFDVIVRRALVRSRAVNVRNHEPFAYDSRVPGSDPGPLVSLPRIIDEPWHLEIDDHGRLLGFKTPAGTDGLTGAVLLDAGLSFANELPLLPDEPKSRGDAWESKIPRPVWRLDDGHRVSSRLVSTSGGLATIDTRVEPGVYELPSERVELVRYAGSRVLDATGRMTSYRVEASWRSRSTLEDGAVSSTTSTLQVEEVESHVGSK